MRVSASLRRTCVCASVSLFSFATHVFAASGAAFLKIDSGARAVGMGSAFTAIADDASAIYWNPAGTANFSQRQVFFMHSQWLQSMNFESASFVQPIRTGALGLGFSYFSEGTLEGRGDDRKATGNFSASDMAAYLSFSRRISNGSWGLNLKLIRQGIESEEAVGIASDLGAKFQRAGSPLSLGLAVQNLGPQMKFEDQSYALPLTLAIGAGFKVSQTLTVSMDARQRVYSGNTNVNVGAEYWMFNTFALRTGYLSALGGIARSGSGSNVSGTLEGISGFGAGVGLKVFGYQIDYALVPYGELGNTHRISLLASF